MDKLKAVFRNMDTVKDKILYGRCTMLMLRDFSLVPGNSYEKEIETSTQCQVEINFNTELKAGLDKLGITAGMQAKISRSVSNKQKTTMKFVNNTRETQYYMKHLYCLTLYKIDVYDRQGGKFVDIFKSRVGTITTPDQFRELTKEFPDEYRSFVRLRELKFIRLVDYRQTDCIDRDVSEKDLGLTLTQAINLMFT